MTDAQAVRCRKRLEQFLVDLLEPVGRSQRRRWGGVYVRSLLLDGERKSIQPLATRLPEGNVQAMQQFIGQSPWEWNLIWERLGKRMTAELEPDPAWVVDDTGFPKQGTHSVAVERQYSGTLGKTGNCQIAVSVHHVANKEMYHWDGGCICRRVGPTTPSGGSRRAFRRESSFVRSGNWHWKSSIRSESGACPIEWCWVMPATEMAPNSEKNWKSG